MYTSSKFRHAITKFANVYYIISVHIILIFQTSTFASDPNGSHTNSRTVTTAHISSPIIHTNVNPPTEGSVFVSGLTTGIHHITISVNSSLPVSSELDYNLLLPKCSPPCANDGVCRVVGTNVTNPSCICQVDYKGIDCKEEAQPQLKFCDESTCKNGGTCTGTETAPLCSCPTDILGRYCERRVRSYEINLLLVNSNNLWHWTSAFGSPSSSLYKNTSNRILNMIDMACKLGQDLLLVRSYYGSEFLGFRNGSVYARVKVKFDFDDATAQNYTESKLRHHIQTGGLHILKSAYAVNLEIPTDFGITNASTFTLEAVNPCTSGNNDCSVNADCTVVAPGVYTCACKAFTIDSSMNKSYPGRRCLYDGLIIFSFILVGSLVSMLIFLLCGCRRTIWYRYQNRGHPEHLTLVNMPSNYDI